jgi:hypothetical protein
MGGELAKRSLFPTYSPLISHRMDCATGCVIVGPSNIPKSHGDTLDDTLELKILALARQNPRINQRELSEQLAISLWQRLLELFPQSPPG